MLLGILLDNIKRNEQALLRYMLTSARVSLASKWKAEEPLTRENRKDKLAEYTVMAKITSYVNKRPAKEYQEKWKAYYAYFPQKKERNNK